MELVLQFCEAGSPLLRLCNAILDAVRSARKFAASIHNGGNGSGIRSAAAFFAAEGTKAASRSEANTTAEHLLNAYGNNILRLAYSYLHNMEDAEEIVQDTLLQYLKETPAFNDAEHEKAWCLRVAGNLAKNRIKYNKVREADELNNELVAENREDLTFVWDAVKSLPETYRETVHLF